MFIGKTRGAHHIFFWSFKFEKLKRNLEEFGYAVDRHRKSDAWWKGGP
jgi:hypothetical protein